MSAKRLPPALLALSSGDLLPARFSGFLTRTEQALAAGLRGVLLREQQLPDRDLLQLGCELRTRLDSVEGWLGLHDRLHLAGPCAVDAVHLGFRSLSVRESRALLGEGLAIGLSTHAGDGPALWEGADYRFFGPLRPVSGKQHTLEPVGAHGIASAARTDPTPLWALGGIRPEDVHGLAGSGARGVAVLSRLLGSADPGAATRAYLDSWLGDRGAAGAEAP